jgi:hypothetical protein
LIKGQALHFNQPTRSGGSILCCRIRHKRGQFYVAVDNEQWRRAAIARYEEQNPGKSATDRKYIRVDMDEKTRALVYPTQGDSWRITKLEQPTARYHYRKDDGVGIFYKVYRQSSKVEDSQSQEVLASYKRYSRKAPWFFIGLSDPGLGCDGPSGGPETGHSFLIYRDVLIPAGGANK